MPGVTCRIGWGKWVMKSWVQKHVVMVSNHQNMSKNDDQWFIIFK
jgi:hypothetical protein